MSFLLLLFACARHNVASSWPPEGLPEPVIAVSVTLTGIAPTPVQVSAVAYRWSPIGVRATQRNSFVMIVVPPVHAAVNPITGEVVLIVPLEVDEDFTTMAGLTGYYTAPPTERELAEYPTVLMVETINYAHNPPESQFQLVVPGGMSPAINRFQRVVEAVR